MIFKKELSEMIFGGFIILWQSVVVLDLWKLFFSNELSYASSSYVGSIS